MSEPRIFVSIEFWADPGVSEDEAYDAALAMVDAAPVECAVLTFEDIRTEVSM